MGQSCCVSEATGTNFVDVVATPKPLHRIGGVSSAGGHVNASSGGTSHVAEGDDGSASEQRRTSHNIQRQFSKQFLEAHQSTTPPLRSHTSRTSTHSVPATAAVTFGDSAHGDSSLPPSPTSTRTLSNLHSDVLGGRTAILHTIMQNVAMQEEAKLQRQQQAIVHRVKRSKAPPKLPPVNVFRSGSPSFRSTSFTSPTSTSPQQIVTRKDDCYSSFVSGSTFAAVESGSFPREENYPSMDSVPPLGNPLLPAAE